MRSFVTLLAPVVLLVAVGACTDDGFTAAVELRTDLTPGVEFNAARTTFEGRTVDHYAGRDEDYLGGVRIADLDGLTPGSHAITVTLLDAEGSVLEREVRVALSGNTAVSVVVARSCRDIACPAPGGDAALSTCVAGQCVDPLCVDDGPYCPPAQCSADAECSVAAACARAACDDGLCFAIGDDAACGDGQYCDPDVGCRLVGGGIPDAGAMDSSSPDSGAPDSGAPETGPADTGTPDTGPSCGSERLLATSARRLVVGDGSTILEWDVVLSHFNGFPQIGTGQPVPNGFSGITEFRAAGEPQFHDVVGALSDGTVANPAIGIKPTSSSTGAFQPMSLSTSLTGKVITLVRRNILYYTLVPRGGGGVDIDTDVEWEYWGCDP